MYEAEEEVVRRVRKDIVKSQMVIWIDGCWDLWQGERRVLGGEYAFGNSRIERGVKIDFAVHVQVKFSADPSVLPILDKLSSGTI